MHFIPEALSNNMLVRLLFALLFGSIIGFERDMHGRSAGLRTNILVSLGSAVFMLISISVSKQFPNANADPGRIAAQIVTGIGFLGAGAIIKQGFSIKGLTTAAGLWISAAIGMGCGGGYLELALFTTALSLFTLQILDLLEKHLIKNTYWSLRIICSSYITAEKLMAYIEAKNLKILSLDQSVDNENTRVVFNFTIRIKTKSIIINIFDSIHTKLKEAGIPVYHISWQQQ